MIVDFPRQFSFAYPIESVVASVGIETGRCDEPLSIYSSVARTMRLTAAPAQPRRYGFNDQEVVVIETECRGARHLNQLKALNKPSRRAARPLISRSSRSTATVRSFRHAPRPRLAWRFAGRHARR